MFDNLTFEELTNLINKMGGPDGVRRFIKNDQGSQENNRLEFITSVHVDGVQEFKAEDFFTTNNKLVKIAYISDNFKNHFLKKVEKDVEAVDVKFHKLLKASLDIEIFSQIGSSHEIKLAHLAGLLKLQPNGEKGALLTNDWANIFYIKDAEEVFWAVDAFWSRGDWSVFAYSVAALDRWHVGYQVGSR